MGETLEIAVTGHVALLRFANPPLNHATIALLRLIADALHRLDGDAQVRAIVLAADGKQFCAGADLVAADGFGGSGDDPLREFYDQALRVFAAAKPIVAAVQGAAVGAGLGLAVAADMRVASPEARLAANFVKLGFHPGFGLSATLPRLIGPQRALEMMLTGERYKPEQVAPWGLVDEIVPAGRLTEAALALAGRIAVNAPLSLLATRATLRAGLVDAVETALVHEHREQIRLKSTADHAEGLRAVAERRDGHFEGR